jgi:hypothetical protein
MIKVEIKNFPVDASYWRPYFKGSDMVAHYPNSRLGMNESWTCDISGETTFRVDLYDASQNIIYDYQTAFQPVAIIDGMEYYFDWGARQLVMVEPSGNGSIIDNKWMPGVIAAAGAIIVLLLWNAKKKGK